MPHVLSHHSDYLRRYGVLRWILRECVRANPLYVISAALIAYGVLQLNLEVDPRSGKVGGMIATLALLHGYELAVLAVAVIVLRRRTGGGRDLHGLMLVAALYFGGSFIALDEQIALTPALGPWLVLGALALATAKIFIYAAQPGIRLPSAYRICILLVVAGHSVSALLGSPAFAKPLGPAWEQGLGWLAGWLSLTPIIWLICTERPLAAATDADLKRDPLSTRLCGGFALFMAMATGFAHLLAADWVFDRAMAWEQCYPEVCMLATIVVFLRWQYVKKLEQWTGAILIAQAAMLQYLWAGCAAPETDWNWALLAGPAVQYWMACCFTYVVLAKLCGRAEFYAWLLGPFFAPVWAWFARMRNQIPHFKALLSSTLGFILLAVGMLVSLYRDRLLRWLDPEGAVPAILPPDNLNLAPDEGALQ